MVSGLNEEAQEPKLSTDRYVESKHFHLVRSGLFVPHIELRGTITTNTSHGTLNLIAHMGYCLNYCLLFYD